MKLKARQPHPARRAKDNEKPLSVRSFCERYAVKREVFTRLTGFSSRAVANWAQGREPGDPAQKQIRETSRLFDALSNVIASQEIGPWLQRSNAAFDGSTPLQVIERGEADRLWRMIYELESGQPD